MLTINGDLGKYEHSDRIDHHVRKCFLGFVGRRQNDSLVIFLLTNVGNNEL